MKLALAGLKSDPGARSRIGTASPSLRALSCWVFFRSLAEKKKAYTTTKRKSFGELFWPQRKTFQTAGGYKNPIKTKKAIYLPLKSFLCGPHFFFFRQSAALEQGGVCFLFSQSGDNPNFRKTLSEWESLEDRHLLKLRTLGSSSPFFLSEIDRNPHERFLFAPFPEWFFQELWSLSAHTRRNPKGDGRKGTGQKMSTYDDLWRFMTFYVNGVKRRKLS